MIARFGVHFGQGFKVFVFGSRLRGPGCKIHGSRCAEPLGRVSSSFSGDFRVVSGSLGMSLV